MDKLPSLDGILKAIGLRQDIDSDGYQLVGPAIEIAEGSSKVISLSKQDGSTDVAIFNVSGNYYAIDNLCAHKEAQLCKGDIEDIGSSLNLSTSILCVRCPKHRKKFAGGLYFSLETGESKTKAFAPKYDPEWRLSTYPIKLRENNLYVSINPRNPCKTVRNSQNVAKDEKLWARINLIDIKKYNHDTNYYIFKLDMEEKKVRKENLKVIKEYKNIQFVLWHFELRASDPCVPGREYTPISTMEEFIETNQITLLIKLYDYGSMSKHLAKSKIGDQFYMGTPRKTMEIDLSPDVNYAFIAGGTGLTPFYQLARQISMLLDENKPAPKFSLFYSNKKLDDILLKDELDQLQEKYKDHIRIQYALTREGPEFKHDTILMGKINEERVKSFLHPDTHVRAAVSGPKGMWESVFEMLKSAGYKEIDCTELEA